MADTESWLWYSGSTLWPGFTLTSQDNLGANGNGLSVDPSTYTASILRDANDDGIINDADTDDESLTTVDRVIIGGVEKTVLEIAQYINSTIVIDGVTYTDARLGVSLFTDGTYAARLLDISIPIDAKYTKVSKITLGTFDGVEYVGAYVATFDAPFVCFTAGTPIDTARGPVPIERLRPGDLVATLDHGLQPLRWIGMRRVRGDGVHAPVLIRAGAFDNGVDIRLSPQHRVLVSGWRAELWCGTPEVLVAAKDLVNGSDVVRAPSDWVTYVHILFDRHEIVASDGLLSESFHPGPHSATLLDEDTRAEVLALFPELGPGFQGGGPTARMCATGKEAQAMMSA
ncbi:Hint domain-containing protein [Phaeovulum sp. NW3]|uniref:Hint domain-containing protein n=1 Tax=Phaeovulum sp. NW3 TaxID=2934933 RepID=UPI0020214736|nr:Hint domain-containing protein [Phaeovulum sp. NW3]MCL7464342.1 Hint domain-containing protein [Phaeovulum sp. NW3]